MGRPPAYIFVVRHGYRLDAVDKQWHLTSPTPYDPPLTYGGWVHSRAVGARIAAILRDEVEAEVAAQLSSEPSSSSSPSHRRRRFRLILHSSPFIRCVQTSIAISAGVASIPAASPVSSDRVGPVPRPSKPAPFKTRPSALSATLTSSHHHDGTGHPHDPDATPSPTRVIDKSILRLDAFLGEWLSPEYFEHITPPPESALMLATAKAELLRRSSYHDYPHFHAHVHSSASSHLWTNASPDSATHESHDAHSGTSGLGTMSHLATNLPGHESNNHDHSHGPSASGYVFPVPAYALSSSEPIPRGYVAHARDACLTIDYQWDSSRDNFAWGDGGTLPEEWASMHQRFRKGLRRLVDWYDAAENPAAMMTRIASSSNLAQLSHFPHTSDPDCAIVDDDEDSDIEDVVVLVSHGAGCNALVGALTQQPVLADIAMSSLTMAKRRPGFDYRDSSHGQGIPHQTTDGAAHVSGVAMPDLYELKLFANTAHLTTPSSPATLSRSASTTRQEPHTRSISGYTSALKEINFGSLYGGSPGGRSGRSANASLGSMRRSSGAPSLVPGPPVYNTSTAGVSGGGSTSGFSITRPDRSGSGTWGLWSPRQDNVEQDKEPRPLVLPDFRHESATSSNEQKDAKQQDEKSAQLGDLSKSPTITNSTPDTKVTPPAQGRHEADHHDEEHDKFDKDAAPRLWPSKSSGGLWGAPRPPGEAERLRDFSASKRRWTVTEP
ncbi:hypothetical protein F4777DRAFT_19802 [Nemania sp. FL0916]|nr:hypothetical protein F4777DRAFT_19802 [Nemania sp. FL0916]